MVNDFKKKNQSKKILMRQVAWHGASAAAHRAFPAFPFASFEMQTCNLTVWVLDILIEFRFCIRALKHIVLGRFFCFLGEVLDLSSGSTVHQWRPSLLHDGQQGNGHGSEMMANEMMVNEIWSMKYKEIMANTHLQSDTMVLYIPKEAKTKPMFIEFADHFWPSMLLHISLWLMILLTPKALFQNCPNNMSWQNKLNTAT